MSGPYNTVPNVLRQHVEDAAVLHATRTGLTTAPHVRLKHLLRFDARLAAHLDGLLVAGNDSWAACAAELERPRPGPVFTVATLALESGNAEQLRRLYALAEAVPESLPGLLGAFGWTAPARLRGVVASLLNSTNACHRLVGVAASAMHRVDPAIVAARRTEDPHPLVRARALRSTGELGMARLVSGLAAAIDDEDPHCRFWAAWSAVLLGDRERALEYLTEVAANTADAPQQLRARAFQLCLQAKTVQSGHQQLRALQGTPADRRRKIQGAGWIGDPAYVPWLIRQMGAHPTARVAGESFSLITGADLAWLDLERKPPENAAAGPNDDPEDSNVDPDADEGLPWPDPDRVQRWWATRAAQFESGQRWFMGEPLTAGVCLQTLRGGFQRQRIAAAIHLSLLAPGKPLFEWRAPVARQYDELARLD